MTQTTQMTQTTHEWITRLADDERKRDAVRSGEVEAVARKAALVQRHGRALVDGLRVAVTADIDAFRAQFPGDAARDVSIEGGADGGFAVRKPGYPMVSLSVAPRWAAASVDCHYRRSTADGLPAREDRFALVFVPHGDDSAQFKHLESGLLFADAEALSEYLLTPVFTGRTR